MVKIICDFAFLISIKSSANDLLNQVLSHGLVVVYQMELKSNQIVVLLNLVMNVNPMKILLPNCIRNNKNSNLILALHRYEGKVISSTINWMILIRCDKCKSDCAISKIIQLMILISIMRIMR